MQINEVRTSWSICNIRAPPQAITTICDYILTKYFLHEVIIDLLIKNSLFHH